MLLQTVPMLALLQNTVPGAPMVEPPGGEGIPETFMYQLGEVFYWVIIAYAVAYVLWFFWPLFEFTGAERLREDLDRLKTALQREVNLGGKAVSPVNDEIDKLEAQIEGAENELARLVVLAADAEDEGEVAEADEIRNERIPEVRQLLEQFHAAREKLGERQEKDGVARLESVQALYTEYNNPFVHEVVDQLRARFPRADYHRFELDRLPTYNIYTERVAMARGMAGLFVLVGLLGTMIKLDGVVDAIRALTASAEMEPGVFLDRMGVLMQGISGAFDNSIYGVLLMVAALIGIGFINRVVQKRLDEVEGEVTGSIVPNLLRLHNRYMPIRGTQSQLDRLNVTVESLNQETLNSLGLLNGHVQDMGERMSAILAEFGSYQQYYATLNDWVKELKGVSTELNTASTGMKASSKVLAEPIDAMNITLQEHLKLQAQFKDSSYIESLLTQIREAVGEAVGTSNTQLDALTEQTEAVKGQMEATAEALRASGPKQLDDAIQKLNAAVQQLSQSTEQIGVSLSGSAQSLQHAATGMEQYASAPTFFFWLTQRAFPSVGGWVMRRLGRTPRRKRAGSR